MDSNSPQPDWDEGPGPIMFVKMLQILETCAEGDRDYQLLFKPSADRLDVLRGVLLSTDLDGSLECCESKSVTTKKLTECVMAALTGVERWRASAFVKAASRISDQKRIWGLLLEKATYVQDERQLAKCLEKARKPPVPSTFLRSGLPSRPLESVPDEDDDDPSKNSGASRPHPQSGGQELALGLSGQEGASDAGGSVAPCDKPGCEDARSEVSQREHVANNM